ncbi:hypothetical protein I6F34_01260 [Bradyrhizobium sp. BRP05]|nr:hypothetical protein [Bradyrhizobium sp. BRP05]
MSAYKSCPCPKTSPWGAIQDKRELAPGIWSVSTASHGGIKLSRERNAAMPAYMRNEGGWYEEDCEWAKAAVVHPIGFQRVVNGKTEFDHAMATLRNWHPDAYEKFSGLPLVKGQSLIRDEQIFKAETHDKFVLRSAWGDWAHWVPKGKIGVYAHRESDKAEKWFLLDKASYEQRRAADRSGIVIDPAIDTEIAKPERP